MATGKYFDFKTNKYGLLLQQPIIAGKMNACKPWFKA